MKQLVFAISFFCLFLSTNAQTLKPLQAKAFYIVSSPGILRADENGNPVNSFTINRFIYVVIKSGDVLAIKKITAAGKKYETETTKLSAKKINAGHRIKDNKPEIITAAKGMSIWKITFKNDTAEENVKPLKNIIIDGYLNNKSFKYTVKENIQLIGPMYY